MKNRALLLKIKTYVFLSFLFIISATNYLSSQTEVLIGGEEDEVTRYLPMNTIWRYSYSQQLVLASEITETGWLSGDSAWITKISILPTNTVSTEAWRNIKIYLGNTNKTSMWQWVSGNLITEVFSGDIMKSNVFAGEWLDINLTTPFLWDGQSNLVVAFYKQTPYTNGGQVNWSGYNTSGSVKRIYCYSDSQPINIYSPPSNPPSEGHSNDSTVARLKFEFIDSKSCEDVATVGNIITNSTSVCSGEVFTLNLENNPFLTGVTYQWESASNIDFTENIQIISTNHFLTTSIDSETYFRCLVSCAAGDDAEYSNPILMSLKPELDCYCTILPYSSYIGSYITSFSLGELEEENIGSLPRYENRMNEQNAVPNLIPETPMEASFSFVKVGVNNYPIKMFIDYNQNREFDEDELIVINTAGNTTVSAIVTVPQEALEGYTMMRVYAPSSPMPEMNTPCSAFSGNVRDYLVYITSFPECVAPKNISVNYSNSIPINITWDASEFNPDCQHQIYISQLDEEPDESTVPTFVIPAGTTDFSLLELLEPNSNLYLWIRSDCGDNNFSAWSYKLIATTPVYATIPWLEEFSSNTVPQAWNIGWAQYALSILKSGATMPYSSNYFLYKWLEPNTVYSFSTIPIGLFSGEEIFSFDYRFAYTYGSFGIYDSVPEEGSILYEIEYSKDFGQTWASLDSFTNSGLGGWHTKNYALSEIANSGDCVKFKFKISTQVSNARVAFDDFSVGLCDKPRNLSITNEYENSVEISWSPSEFYPTDNYDVYYSLLNDAPTINTIPSFSVENGDTTALIENLLPSRTYYIWVRSNCGNGNYSTWHSLVFVKTACDTINVPYYQNFEFALHNEIPHCNMVHQEEQTDVVFWSTANPTFGLSSTCLNYIYEEAPLVNSSYFIPKIHLQGDQYYRISYKYLKTNDLTPGATKLVYGTSVNTEDLITILDHYSLGLEFNEVVVDFSPENDGVYYIGFVNNTNLPYFEMNEFFDDFKIEISSLSCINPVNLKVNNISTNSANFSWQSYSSPENGYQVYYNFTNESPNENTIPNYEVPQSETSLYLNGLNSATSYFVWIRSNCGNDNYGEWQGPVLFTTNVAPVAPASLPYYEDFSENNFTFINKTQANKWAYGAATGNPANSIYISNDWGDSNNYDINTSSVVHAYRDIIIPSDATYADLTFDWKCEGQPGSDMMKVWLMSNSINPVAGASLSTNQGSILYTIQNSSSEWQEAKKLNINVSGFAGNTARLIFEWINNSANGNQPPVAVDNIKFTINTCLSTSRITISSVAINTAVISWIAPSQNPESYDVYFSTSNVCPANNISEFITTNNNSITLTSLEPQTKYYVWVRSVCDENNKSEWFGSANFTTLCTEVGLPITEGFESENIPECWSKLNISQFVCDFQFVTSGSYPSCSPKEGSRMVYWGSRNSTYNKEMRFIAPPFSTIDIAHIDVEFYWYHSDLGYDRGEGVQVQYSLDGITWQNVGDFIPRYASTGWSFKKMPIYEIENQTQVYVGLLFKSGSFAEYNCFLDAFSIKPIPCYKPTNLHVIDETINSGTIEWNESPSYLENGYQVFYSQSNIPPENNETNVEVTSTNSITLSSLEESSVYYVWVRSNCSDYCQSEWLGPVILITHQTPATLPYYEDFETNQFVFNNGSQTNKWVYGSGGNLENMIFISDDGVNNTYDTNSQSIVHAYREIAIPNNIDYENFSFSWKTYGEGTRDFLTVWLVPIDFTPEPGKQITPSSDRIQVGTYFNQKNTWQTYYTSNVNISNFAGQTIRLVFQWRNDKTYGTQAPAAIKNIALGMPLCNNPSDIQAVEVSYESANLTWQSQVYGSQESYHVYASQSNIPPTEDVSEFEITNTNSIILNNLEQNTIYYIWVRVSCDENVYGEWVGPCIIHTNCGIITFTHFEGFNEDNLPNCWALIDEFEDFPPLEVWESVANYDDIQPFEGSHMVRSGDLFSWLISPKIVVSNNNLKLLFYYIGKNISENAALCVRLSKTGSALDDFNIVIENIENINSTWQYKEYSFSDFEIVEGDEIYIAFRYFSSSEGEALLIDALKIGEFETPSNEAEILSFSFLDQEQIGETIIDNLNNEVSVVLKTGADLSNLVASFELSQGAVAKIGEIFQKSNITQNDFTEPLIYTIVAEDGITTRDWTVTVNLLSTIEINEKASLFVYPNPNNGKFTLEFNNVYDKVNCLIFDTKGSVIFSDNFTISGNVTKNISLNLPQGVYFIRLITESNTIIEKLVIER